MPATSERLNTTYGPAATWLASSYGLQRVGYYLSAATLLSLAGLTLAPETRDSSLS